MKKVQNIINTLTHKFPLKNAEEWDNVGHQLGDEKYECKGVVVALDLTNEVFNKAIKNKANLIVVHHPFLFEEELEDDIAKAPYKLDLINRIENTGINVLALHTNYDSAEGGMSDQIISKFNFKDIIKRYKYGLGVKVSITLEELETKLLENNIEIIYKNFEKLQKIKKLAFLPGAGSPEGILEFSKYDLIITSDVKWSTWVMAKEEKINILEVPHSIEEVFIDHISSIIKKNYKNVNVMKHYIDKTKK